MSAPVLTAIQIEELERDLRALRRELVDMVDMSDEGARPVDLDQPIGRLSRMDAIQQQKMAESTRGAARRRLQKVGAALVAIDEGTYGDCHECEEPIGFRRLKAKPESRFCVACQSARERR